MTELYSPPEECKSWSHSLIEMHLVRLSNAEAAASRRKSRGIIYALKQTGPDERGE